MWSSKSHLCAAVSQNKSVIMESYSGREVIVAMVSAVVVQGGVG